MNPRDISYLSQGNKKRIVPSSPLSSVWLEAMYGEDLRYEKQLGDKGKDLSFFCLLCIRISHM